MSQEGNTDKEQQLKKCLSEIKTLQKVDDSNENKDQVKVGLETLGKLLNNIVSNPEEEKFKKLNTQNKSIQAKLMKMGTQEQMNQMFELLQYVKSQEDETIFINQGNSDFLKACIAIVQQEVEALGQQKLIKVASAPPRAPSREKSPIISSRGTLRKKAEGAELQKIQEQIKKERELKQKEEEAQKQLQEQKISVKSQSTVDLLKQINKEFIPQSSGHPLESTNDENQEDVDKIFPGASNEHVQENNIDGGIFSAEPVQEMRESALSGLSTPQRSDLSRQKAKWRKNENERVAAAAGGCCVGIGGRQGQQGSDNRNQGRNCAIF